MRFDQGGERPEWVLWLGVIHAIAQRGDQPAGYGGGPLGVAGEQAQVREVYPRVVAAAIDIGGFVLGGGGLQQLEALRLVVDGQREIFIQPRIEFSQP